MAYAPMVERIDYLQQHNFQTYIITGGETDFVREICEEVYGIERSHVIGSAVMVDIEMLIFTEDQARPSLALLMHHDDNEREFAYEDGATTALQIAKERPWQIISMKNDFQRIFSFAPLQQYHK